jgi:hypothetical protein
MAKLAPLIISSHLAISARGQIADKFRFSAKKSQWLATVE